MNEDFLWVEKYRPKTVNDTILPDSLKKTFKQFVEQKNIPNLLLAGSPGVGKTTIARAMLEELECDYVVINGSLEGRSIDVLRNDIANFASSMSLLGGRKYIIIDEADYLGHTVQPALRNFMEDYSANCGFILTCNYKDKIIGPLQSRCSLVEFKITKDERVSVAKAFLKRAQEILKLEGVEYDINVVAEIVKKHYPDWRKCINELQRFSALGKIDSGCLVSVDDKTIQTLVEAMKAKNFGEVRKWIAETNIMPDDLFKSMYELAPKICSPESIPAMIVSLADHQYKAAFVANQDINLASCLATIMAECRFK